MTRHYPDRKAVVRTHAAHDGYCALVKGSYNGVGSEAQGRGRIRCEVNRLLREMMLRACDGP
jgi:hypothetical protein